MFKNTILFFGNILGSSGLESSLLIFPSTSVGVGVGSTIFGSVLDLLYPFNGALDGAPLESLVLGATATGASIAINGVDEYDKAMKELKLTQAYVESLDVSQLSDLIGQLEEKDIELCGEKPKTKIKTL